MVASLTREQQANYGQHGVLFPVSVLVASEATEYLGSAVALERALTERLGAHPKSTQLSQMHLHFDWAYRLATEPRVLDAVQSVLGDDIAVWSSSLFPKLPQDGSYVSWHQDGTYWDLVGDQVTTAWIALSDSRPDNGCMRVVTGSHRLAYQPHRETYAKNNALSRGQEILVDVREDDATDVSLAAGEMSLHDIRIIHGSGPNTSDRLRMGYAIRYVTPEIAHRGGRPVALLARGEDRFGNFDWADPPRHAGLDEAMVAMLESAERQLKSVMGDIKKPTGDERRE